MLSGKIGAFVWVPLASGARHGDGERMERSGIGAESEGGAERQVESSAIAVLGRCCNLISADIRIAVVIVLGGAARELFGNKRSVRYGCRLFLNALWAIHILRKVGLLFVDRSLDGRVGQMNGFLGRVYLRGAIAIIFIPTEADTVVCGP